MPGSFLTLFRDVEDQTPEATKELLADRIWETIAESLDFDSAGVDVRWLSPATRRLSRNATSVHLKVEYTADEKLRGDAETLDKLGQALLEVMNKTLPKVVWVDQIELDVDYDVWIITAGQSNLTYYGNGVVGKGFKGSVGGLPPSATS